MQKIRRALLSVSDKTGIIDLAKQLAADGCQLLSTGGTAKLLRDGGLTIVAVSDFTGAAEILGGRVKTLHPKIAGGILAVRSDAGHRSEMEQHGIEPIDMVVVNLYPFQETIQREGVTLAEAIENIDIGGPTMIRAAAKNHDSVAVVTDPEDYAGIADELGKNDGALSAETRSRLARKAFRLTASYDSTIARWLATDDEQRPERTSFTGVKVQELRYGENPHQSAAFYRTADHGFGVATKHQGKELSYNNLVDLDAAVGLARDLGETCAVIVKHTNPCGAARGTSLADAYRRARATDPTSAFGGVVALTQMVDLETATELTSTFIEAVAAPGYQPDALEQLSSKKNLRVIEMPLGQQDVTAYRQIAGGLLVQDADRLGVELENLEVVSKRQPTDLEMRALRFAWIVAKHVKSNAIVYTNDGQTVGVGAGQMSRIDSARVARDKAVLEIKGTVAASDAFFPFRDGIDQIAAAGVVAIIQPGGSIRDEEVIAAADEHGLAMVFTGERHFRH